MVAVVFGARGNVGRHVAADLLAAGEQVRATSRNPDTATFSPELDVVAADLERPETLPAALAGAEKVFVYAKPDGVEGFVTAAEEAGVRHVVLLSSAAVGRPGSEQNPIAQRHRTVEQAIEKSTMDWTFVRAGMFATNTVWWWAHAIRDEGVVRMPYPNAQTAPVHEKDLAALAVTALTNPGHAGQAYTVWGPESLTLREQVTHISDAIGHPVAIEEVTPEQARDELTRTLPPPVVDIFLRIWSTAKGPAAVSTTVADVTGHRAHTFAEWATDHADDFR